MLPKIDLPTYEIRLPSNDQIIRIRPFVVKEEKLLLMALESGEESDIIQTTQQIVNNCVLDNIDIDTLPFFDVDYVFIALRAKSIGESIDIKFTCNHAVQETSRPCGEIFSAKIDISNYKVVKNENIVPKINLTSQMSVHMKYPSYSKMRKIMSNYDDFDKTKIIAECIDMIVDGEKVYTRKDYTPQEMIDFVEGLPQQFYKRLEEFVDNFPSFVVISNTTCPRCRHEHEIEYKEFTSFFV